MCNYTINRRHDISRIEFCRRYAASLVRGRLTEASRPRLQFSAPLRGFSSRYKKWVNNTGLRLVKEISKNVKDR
jgi:hypothetical protein